MEYKCSYCSDTGLVIIYPDDNILNSKTVKCSCKKYTIIKKFYNFIKRSKL